MNTAAGQMKASEVLVMPDRVRELVGAEVADAWLYGIVHRELEHGRHWRWIPGSGGGQRFTLEGLAEIATWLERMQEPAAAGHLREEHARLVAEQARQAAAQPKSWAQRWEDEHQ